MTRRMTTVSHQLKSSPMTNFAAVSLMMRCVTTSLLLDSGFRISTAYNPSGQERSPVKVVCSVCRLPSSTLALKLNLGDITEANSSLDDFSEAEHCRFLQATQGCGGYSVIQQIPTSVDSNKLVG